MVINKIKRYINDPGRMIERLNSKGYLNWISDERFLKWQYKRNMGEKLNLDNPKTMNEKLQWIKLYDRNPDYINLVDKYEVRNVVEEKIGAEYLIPLLGVWDTVDEINWEDLPNKFVLKCTHDSGGVIICKDKEKLNISETKEKLQKLLNRDYYLAGREWPYKDVRRKIIAEKFMENLSSSSLSDYKFYCFNGEPKLLFIASDRDKEVKYDFYNMEFEHLPIGLRNSKKELNKPEKFEEMIQIAKTLSKGIPHVRIDLYNINGKIYFGEFTFFTDSGYEVFAPDHEKFSNIFGSWIDLPTIKQ